MTTNSVANTHKAASKDYDSMYEEVQSLRRELKESHERTEAMMRDLLGAFNTASATTTELTQIKRERIKEEDEDGSNEAPAQISRLRNRQVKRCRTIIEID